MCKSPIHIINRSRRFRLGIDKPVLTVPCGKCEECQNRKQDDWFVRACAEYQRVKRLGGFVWYPTFTYRNEDLPVWIDKQACFAAPVFDKDHFVSFRNKLRVYLKREGYDFKGNKTIRFLYVTEYGEKKGRSHLHGLLFVPSFVPFHLFKSLVAKAWIYGQVRYSPEGLTINSVKALRYTMKYMHKDLLWYDKYHVDDYINYLRDKCKSTDIKEKNYFLGKYREFKRHLPHHAQSMGFGSDFAINDNEFVDNTVSSHRLGLYDVKFNYSIPMYYKRRFLYDFDNVEKIYSINPRGIHIKQMRFNRLIDHLDKYYANVVYTNKVLNIVKNFFPDMFRVPGFVEFQQLRKYDTKDIAYFALCYRGLPIKEHLFKVYDGDDENHFLNELSKQAFYWFCVNIDNVGVECVDDYRHNGARESIDYIGYSHCNVYKIFDRGLNFLELCEQRFAQMENDSLVRMYYKQVIQFGKLFGTVAW